MLYIAAETITGNNCPHLSGLFPTWTICTCGKEKKKERSQEKALKAKMIDNNNNKEKTQANYSSLQQLLYVSAKLPVPCSMFRPGPSVCLNTTWSSIKLSLPCCLHVDPLCLEEACQNQSALGAFDQEGRLWHKGSRGTASLVIGSLQNADCEGDD